MSTQERQVLVFSTSYLPYKGGAEIAIREITKRLPSLHFIILTSRFSPVLPRREYHDNIEIIRIGFGCSLDKFFLPFLGFIKAFGLARGCKREKTALWGMMLSYGSIAAYFLKLVCSKMPFLITLQEGDSVLHIKKGKGGVIGFFWRRILGRADEAQAISNYLAGLATAFGFKKTVHIIPNGVDWEYFSRARSREEKEKMRRLFGVTNHEKVIISVSRLVEKNGLSDLITALQYANSAKLVLVGSGYLERVLKKTARELGVADRIFFAGDVDYQEIPLYLQSADVFIRPSLSEGLGNAFLEAMAAGIPVIGTPVGGIPDFLQEGKTGLFVEVGNPRSIADALNKLFSDLALYEKLKENGRNIVKETYNWDRIALSMKEIFARL